jgi:hypothetical protein
MWSSQLRRLPTRIYIVFGPDAADIALAASSQVTMTRVIWFLQVSGSGFVCQCNQCTRQRGATGGNALAYKIQNRHT